MTKSNLKISGFTLIEVIIALFIFAILATISSYVLIHSFKNTELLKVQSNKLHAIDLAITYLRRDTEQIINRSVHIERQQYSPSFSGSVNYVEFTRSGVMNTGANLTQSALRRVAYLCKNKQLIRRTWDVLDSPNRSYRDTILLSNLKNCSFSYTNQLNQSLLNWIIPVATSDHQKINPIPTSINCNLDILGWGQLSIILVLPIGLYV